MFKIDPILDTIYLNLQHFLNFNRHTYKMLTICVPYVKHTVFVPYTCLFFMCECPINYSNSNIHMACDKKKYICKNSLHRRISTINLVYCFLTRKNVVCKKHMYMYIHIPTYIEYYEQQKSNLTQQTKHLMLLLFWLILFFFL